MTHAVYDELLVLPSLKAHRNQNGALMLTQKFLNGVGKLAEGWPGPVTALVYISELPSSDMDHVVVPPNSTNLRVEIRPTSKLDFRNRIRDAAAALVFLSPFERTTSTLCVELGIPLVFWSEFSPKTEGQIVDAETSNPIIRLRRRLWIHQAERKRRRMLQFAAGIQCSGLPAYNAYCQFSSNAILFFDNRVPEDDVLNDSGIDAKVNTVVQPGPLRLVFGGRLVPMKGVMHLAIVADRLHQMGVDFHFDIYGDGVLKKELAQDIIGRGLQHCVTLKGVLDFRTQWIPMLKSGADLFVCCHPQGDPSSTYPEVMSCGVPIAGYGNEALVGIVQHSGCGWLTPINDPEALARTIARLAHDRREIAKSSRLARDFALAHCFERTFAARADHLVALSRLPESLKNKVKPRSRTGQ